MVQTFEDTMYQEIEAGENLRSADESLQSAPAISKESLHLLEPPDSEEKSDSGPQDVVPQPSAAITKVRTNLKRTEKIRTSLLEMDSKDSALRKLFSADFGVKLKPAKKRTWTCSCNNINRITSHTCSKCSSWRCYGCETIMDSEGLKCTACGQERSWKCPKCKSPISVKKFKCSKCYFDSRAASISTSPLPTVAELKTVDAPKKKLFVVNDGQEQVDDIAEITSPAVASLKHIDFSLKEPQVSKEVSVEGCKLCGCKEFRAQFYEKRKCVNCFHFKSDHP
eukprot:TRINITY_DN2561_c0_g1_i1.p1 TRINITY_DN2561_c0_g1~~TRINITY_DN2561_c0_g1_i1.p1  ORF type:complete len:281 (+),score=54.12 TRINITY_DN2561_c0_g1_i1:919-1761(+)